MRVRSAQFCRITDERKALLSLVATLRVSTGDETGEMRQIILYFPNSGCYTGKKAGNCGPFVQRGKENVFFLSVIKETRIHCPHPPRFPLDFL